MAEKVMILMAYSRGADFSLLAKIARDVLGDKSSAIILDSENYQAEMGMQLWISR